MSEPSVKNDKIIPFLLGLTLGWSGVRYLVHLAYIVAVVGAFVLGHYV
jgi:hypothetical protein